MNPQLTTPDSAMKNSSNSRGSLNEPRFRLEPVKTEKARRSLKAFLMQAWPILEPGTELVEGIHIDAICLHLQAVTEGRIPNLIINVPPGHAKSLLTGVFGLRGLGSSTPNPDGCSAATVSHWRSAIA